MREFVDERGRRWTVWDVSPKPAERRQKNVGPPTDVRERGPKPEPLTQLPLIVTVDWLASKLTTVSAVGSSQFPLPRAGGPMRPNRNCAGGVIWHCRSQRPEP